MSVNSMSVGSIFVTEDNPLLPSLVMNCYKEPIEGETYSKNNATWTNIISYIMCLISSKATYTWTNKTGIVSRRLLTFSCITFYLLCIYWIPFYLNPKHRMHVYINY